MVNLSSIYDSPRVWMHDGSAFDNLENWILVTVKSKDNIVKKSKGNFYRVELEITLPEQNRNETSIESIKRRRNRSRD